MYINKEQLVSYIKKLYEPKVLVIGDLAIDEMIYGDAERISREAPVLILLHSDTKLILGAASNAAHNVSTLNNGKVSVIGVCGDDFQAGQLIAEDLLLILQEKQLPKHVFQVLLQLPLHSRLCVLTDKQMLCSVRK